MSARTRVSRWFALKLPAEPSLCADAQLVLNAALGLVNQLERVPHPKHRAEALLHLDRAVMVAVGGFVARQE